MVHSAGQAHIWWYERPSLLRSDARPVFDYSTESRRAGGFSFEKGAEQRSCSTDSICPHSHEKRLTNWFGIGFTRRTIAVPASSASPSNFMYLPHYLQ